MAPVELLNPESCGCNTTCSTGHCPSRKKPAKPCSQFCGCDEKCENTDPAPQEIIEHDDDDNCEDDIEIKKICVCSGKCATVRCYCRSYRVTMRVVVRNVPIINHIMKTRTLKASMILLTKELEINILRSRWYIYLKKPFTNV